MTAEETQQVQTYITNLNNQHAMAIQALHVKYAATHGKVMADAQNEIEREKKYRKMAQADSLRMGTALVHIWNYSVENPTMPPAQFMICVRQMLNYYAQDFEVPF